MRPIEIFLRDHENVLAFIDKCDGHIFKIRSWALATCSAIIAYSITKNEHWIVFTNILLVPAFLYMECVYKSLQDDAIARSVELDARIQRYFQDQKGTGWSKGYKFGLSLVLQYPSMKQITRILGNPHRRHIVAFYGFILLFSCGAFFIGSYLASSSAH